MDQFGKPGAPQCPPINYGIDGSEELADGEPFMGATLTSIFSEGIRSATGLPDLNGACFYSLTSESYAYSQGLRQLDVIRKIKGTVVTTKESFWIVYNQIPQGSVIDLEIYRNQAPMNLSIIKKSGTEKLNDTAGVKYTGSDWLPRDSSTGGAGSYNDDINATTANGDYFEFTFYGTGIDMITSKYSDEGDVDIYIDDVFQQTISCYSTTRLYQQVVYSKMDLPSGVHTIKGVKKTGSYMIVDAFNIYDTYSESGILNDDASEITYIGTWHSSEHRGYGDYGDDVHYTTNNDDYFELTFTGTGVEYITEKNSDQGNVDIYIDDVLQTTVSCYNATRLSQQTVYSKTDLPSGVHTIKVVKKSGQYALLDALKIY